MTDVQGRALVTGAGARLGRAMAQALGARGHAVAVHYASSADGAEETAAAIRDAGGRAVTLQADLLDEAAAAALVGQASEALGPSSSLSLVHQAAAGMLNSGRRARARWTASALRPRLAGAPVGNVTRSDTSRLLSLLALGAWRSSALPGLALRALLWLAGFLEIPSASAGRHRPCLRLPALPLLGLSWSLLACCSHLLKRRRAQRGIAK